MFYRILENISINNPIPKKIPLNKISDKFANNLIDFSKLQNIFNNELNIFKVWNQFDIHDILYNKEKFVKINENISDLSINFYLSLLIEYSTGILDYEYEKEYIQNLPHLLNGKKDQLYYFFILSKIILILSDNFKNNPKYEEDKSIDEIIQDINKDIENNNLLKVEDINDKSINEIYVLILKDLIENKKFENLNEAINIMNQISMDNIDINEEMFNDIKEIFNKEETKEEYLIKNEEDFQNINKINFYYIFLKYIFKNSLFIYNFDFFYNTRKFIIQKINEGYNINYFLSSNDIGVNTRIKYIIETLLDLEYYVNKLNINPLNNKEDNASNSQLKESRIVYSDDDSYNDAIFDNQDEQYSKDSFNSESDYSKSYQYKTSFCQSNNSLIIKEFYGEILQFKKRVNEGYNPENKGIDFIEEYKSGFICGGTGYNFLELYDRNHQKIFKDINLEGNILNNIVINEFNNDISIKACFDYRVLKYDFKDNIPKIEKNNFVYELDNKIYSSSSLSYFYEVYYNHSLIVNSNKIVSIIYDSKITRVNKRFINIPSVKSIIKINDEILAFKSCDLYDINKNKIIFYDIKKFEEYPKVISGYSFIHTPYGLSVVGEDGPPPKNKILLCACKKYSEGQKNGILLINLQLSETDIKKNTFFYDTGDFEVYCFCPILIINYSEIIKNDFIYKETKYVLVGGYDSKKQKGSIKLFKLIFDNDSYKNEIEFLQDIDDEYTQFNGPVTCIKQEKYSLDKNILVTSWDGSISLFSGPNIDYYLKMDENEEVYNHYESFFSSKD